MLHRQFAEPSIEQQIKDYFYNEIVSHVLDHGEISRDNLAQKINAAIIQVLTNVLLTSKKSEHIRLPTGKVIRMAECPDRYKELFAILNQLKRQEINNKALAVVASRIMAMDSFRDMDPTQFLLEANGLASPVIQHVHYDMNDVTTALIRETFYNEMAIQAALATDQRWMLLTKENLEDQDSHIFWALPGLTILEAIQKSLNCDGIRLLKDKMVNNANCPQEEDFPDFFKTLLQIKSTIKKPFTEEELMYIKHKIACEAELPNYLKNLPNEQELKNIANTIKAMAFAICTRPVFRSMVSHVVRTSLEILEPQSPSMRN